MIDDVTARLASLGYNVVESDAWMLNFIIQKVQNHIIKDCGVYDPVTSTMVIPTGLQEIAVDLVVGEFLLAMKSTDQLTGFDFSAAVKSIQEGDTNIAFAIGDGSMSPEQRMNALIGFLLNRGESDLAAHRCVRW